MKIRFLISTMYACSLLLSCAEAPTYEPKPRVATSADQDANKATQKPAADGSKARTSPNPSTMAEASTTTKPPEATPAPAPTPPPAAPAASAGVAATGKTLLTQTCINANCHSVATNTIDAKTAAALQMAGSLMIPAHQANPLFFTPPAPGAAANNFAHVLAYFMSIPTPVMGPALP